MNRLVIIGGFKKADYLIAGLIKHYKIIYLSDNIQLAMQIEKKYAIETYIGDVSSLQFLESLSLKNTDLFVYLSPDDYKNFVSILELKDLLDSPHIICNVNNPKYINYFKDYQIDNLFSSTILIQNYLNNIIEQKTICEFSEFKQVPKVIKIKKDCLITQLQGCLVLSIIRNNHEFIPKDNNLYEDDLVQIFEQQPHALESFKDFY